ncbi:hypothetical protein ABZ371_20415 [Streptomyces sp. NPDC005899]|uniref:hypothetical protein n=1 Tax=Streptomyces sp. NPDC005899 TaxID=3155716 RepID=UPI00340D3BEA
MDDLAATRVQVLLFAVEETFSQEVGSEASSRHLPLELACAFLARQLSRQTSSPVIMTPSRMTVTFTGS